MKNIETITNANRNGFTNPVNKIKKPASFMTM